MNILYNIPRHKNCTNCGECCGLVPASKVEINTIRNYIATHGISPIKHKDKVTCPFRDNEAKKCLIYPVRPTICRLMGVVKGMSCPNGNTCEIGGDKFLPKDKEVKDAELLNFVRW